MKFFKIITRKINANTKLKLPNKFGERYGAEIPRSVMLKLPTGAKWRVEVKKDKEGIWLANGLYKFAESLGIECGHFLMFEYDAKHAVFHIVVIDRSAAEIEYPAVPACNDTEEKDLGGCHSSFTDELHQKIKEENDEDDVENDTEVGRKRSNQTQSPLHDCAQKKAKSKRFRNEQKEKINGNSTNDQYTMRRGYFGRETTFDDEGRIRQVVQGRRADQINCVRTEKAIERAKVFKTDGPVCIIALSPSYVSQDHLSSGGAKKKCQLVFPLSFFEAYIDKTIEEITLWTNDRRIWSVKYRFAKEKHVSFLTHGWKKFATDNDLKAGDVCLFELIEGVENALEVVIFRISDENDSLK